MKKFIAILVMVILLLSFSLLCACDFTAFAPYPLDGAESPSDEGQEYDPQDPSEGEDTPPIVEPVTPDEPSVVDPTPVEPNPDEPSVVDPTPVEPNPDEPPVVDPTPVEPNPDEPPVFDPTPVEPNPDEPSVVDPTPDEPNPDEPPVVDPTPVEPDEPVVDPTQSRLLSPITDSLWSEGNVRYCFNDDETIVQYIIEPDGRVIVKNADFGWKFADDKLLFVGLEQEDLVDISIDDTEMIRSELFDISIVRCDTIFIPLTLTEQRNKTIFDLLIAYENGEFIFSDDYVLFADEKATKIADSAVSEVYAYPNDIATIDILFEGEFDSITLHNYISDSYIYINQIFLPAIDGNWTADEREFATIYEVINHMNSTDKVSITLSKPFVDPIVGEYVYDDRNSESSFKFIFDNRFCTVIKDSGEETFVFSWFFRERAYYILIPDLDGGEDVECELSKTEEGFRAIGTALRDALGLRRGTITITRI